MSWVPRAHTEGIFSWKFGEFRIQKAKTEGTYTATNFNYGCREYRLKISNTFPVAGTNYYTKQM